MEPTEIICPAGNRNTLKRDPVLLSLCPKRTTLEDSPAGATMEPPSSMYPLHNAEKYPINLLFRNIFLHLGISFIERKFSVFLYVVK